jgi:T-complex protein 1 subunit theta
VVDGYEMALEKALEILPTLVCHEVKDLHNVTQVAAAMRSAIASKQYGQEDFLTNLIAKACGKYFSFNICFCCSYTYFFFF